MKEYYIVLGPHGMFVVEDIQFVEPMIEAMCKVNDDDPDDYTATHCTGNDLCHVFRS